MARLTLRREVEDSLCPVSQSDADVRSSPESIEVDRKQRRSFPGALNQETAGVICIDTTSPRQGIPALHGLAVFLVVNLRQELRLQPVLDGMPKTHCIPFPGGRCDLRIGTVHAQPIVVQGTSITRAER